MIQFKSFLLENTLPRLVYHGTTAEAGKLIEKQGLLMPRGQNAGNWGKGLFGGNSSNPDLVYCATDKSIAIDYAKEICRKNGTKEASLILATPNWAAAVPDEDAVLEILSGHVNQLSQKAFTAYAKAIGTDTDSAKTYFSDSSNEYDTDDAKLADDMKRTAKYLVRLLAPDEMTHFFRNGSSGFSTPLEVQKVEYFVIA